MIWTLDLLRRVRSIRAQCAVDESLIYAGWNETIRQWVYDYGR